MSVADAVAEFAARLDLPRRLEAYEPLRYESTAGDLTALHLDDFSGIPFLDGITGVEDYQHRARLRTGDGDVYIASTPAAPGYERYCRETLGLGAAELLVVDPGESRLDISRSAAAGSLRGGLARLAATRGGLIVEPFMGISAVWELAAAVAREGGARVRVLAPPPPVTWIANDKANFEDLVTAVLGPGHLPASQRSRSPQALARALLELSEHRAQVALKRLRSASAMGNQVFDGADLRRRGRAGVVRLVQAFLERTSGCGDEDVLAVSWERATLSPSTQWWLPPEDVGPPRLDGVYEQILSGSEGVFVGSRPSALAADVERRIVSRAGRVAAALQGLGYVGRCSFDHLVLPSGKVLFTECNGRWGGTSTPMNLVDRIHPDGRPPYQAQDVVHPNLVGLTFDELLRRLGRSVEDRGLEAGRFLVYNVGPLERYGKFDVVALGSSREHVDELMTEELPQRLGLTGSA